MNEEVAAADAASEPQPPMELLPAVVLPEHHHPSVAAAKTTSAATTATAIDSSEMNAPKPHHFGKTAPGREIVQKKSKKSQRRGSLSKKAAARTANNNNKADKSNNKRAAQAPIPVADPYPLRIVNPLLELPPNNMITAYDLHQLASLSLHPPDTYSIAYLARVLGWPLPMTARTTQSITWTDHMQQTMPLNNHKSDYSEIPAQGRFYSQYCVTTQNNNNNNINNWLDPKQVDPLYLALLQKPTAAIEKLRPITAAQHGKLIEQVSVLQGVVDQAMELNVMETQKWHVQSLKEYRRRQLTAQESAVTKPVVDETAMEPQESAQPATVTVTPPPPTVSGLVLEKDSVVAIAHYEFVWYPLRADYEMVLQIHDFEVNDTSLLQSSSDNNNNNDDDRALLLLLMALALEQARVCSVWYAIVTVPKSLQEFMETYFGMVAKQASAEDEENVVEMVCDVHNCSSRLAFLRYLEQPQPYIAMELQQETVAASASITTHRWIARLPTSDEVDPRRPIVHKPLALRRASQFFSSAPQSMRQGSVCLRVALPTENNGDGGVTISRLGPQTKAELESVPLVENATLEQVSVELLRDFDLPNSEPTAVEPVQESQLYHELVRKQDELAHLEQGLEPRIRSLMGKVVAERIEYEETGEAMRIYEEQKNFDEYKDTLDRRKELEKAWQEQLEQDMDAVCDVCDDGEVTPDNQILFCESCNVAIHQMCYGIDKIPEGDYYCIPCRFLGRDKVEQQRQERGAPKLATTPLPVVCELCPRRQGAFLQSKSDDADAVETGRWVHATCAKWQGLDYVRIPDLVEDVTELKVGFRRLGIVCSLCRGARGGMNKCRMKDCKRWLHVTCARAVGFCEVIHGEDVHGKVKDNGWSLLCHEHSNTGIPKDKTSIDRLIEIAKEFPPEPEPEIIPIPPMPFDTATGDERKQLLLNREYENELVVELSVKRTYGARCEVCDMDCSFGVRLKCRTCSIVICEGCSLDIDKTETTFRCPSCAWISRQRSDESIVQPHCVACYQPGGFLREAYAKPICKRSYWNTHRKEYERTLFARPFWVHGLCAMWHPKPILEFDTGKVNMSDIVETKGKGLVRPKYECFLCGNSAGLTLRCGHKGCCLNVQGKLIEPAFHVTCARQAGLEVGSVEIGEDDHDLYVKCYLHGGNEYNLRARMEDLIEIEKKRAGSTLSRSGQPMKFSHAARLMHSSIVVVRMLGWAWRWAELWVDYESTWEVLLEPGQRETDMTDEELKIVESTRESRCNDARRCRLAAFGAALRNRSYDTDDGTDYDRSSFERALRNVLSVESLVGPLNQVETDFYVQWLSLAYWSKSRLMGLGSSKVAVSVRSGLCRHIEDGSAKFELGNRILPGKEGNQVFETDDFMRNELSRDPSIKRTPSKNRNRLIQRAVHDPSSGSPRKRGRPPKSAEKLSVGRNKQQGTPGSIGRVKVETNGEGRKRKASSAEADRDSSRPSGSLSNKRARQPNAAMKARSKAIGGSVKAVTPRRGKMGWPKGRPRGKKESSEVLNQASTGGSDAALEKETPTKGKRGWPKGRPRGKKKMSEASNQARTPSGQIDAPSAADTAEKSIGGSDEAVEKATLKTEYRGSPRGTPIGKADSSKDLNQASTRSGRVSTPNAPDTAEKSIGSSEGAADKVTPTKYRGWPKGKPRKKKMIQPELQQGTDPSKSLDEIAMATADSGVGAKQSQPTAMLDEDRKQSSFTVDVPNHDTGNAASAADQIQGVAATSHTTENGSTVQKRPGRKRKRPEILETDTAAKQITLTRRKTGINAYHADGDDDDLPISQLVAKMKAETFIAKRSAEE